MASPLRRTAAALAALTLANCYVSARIPLDRDLDRTALGSKVGRASAQSVLWGVAWGDAGIHAAALDGGLSSIHHADQELFVVLGGAYARLTTIVYGD
jgi:hypothetical protein